MDEDDDKVSLMSRKAWKVKFIVRLSSMARKSLVGQRYVEKSRNWDA